MPPIRSLTDAMNEIARQDARIAALEASLRLAEWGRWSPSGREACPVCHNERNEGHADNCAIGRALLNGGGK